MSTPDENQCQICEDEGNSDTPLRWHRATNGDRVLAHSECWLMPDPEDAMTVQWSEQS